MFALFEGADYLSTFILKEASAAPSLKIAALSLPFVSIKACLHGYYIGLNHSSVPAVSQIVEQITRVGGIYLLSISVFIMGADARIAAWGMVLGKPSSTYPFWQSSSLILSNSIPMVISSGTSCP